MHGKTRLVNGRKVTKMETQNNLESCLQIWKEVYSGPTKPNGETGDHLSMETLYRMSQPGGIEGSAAEAVTHLSLCPTCLEEWASWRSALAAVEALENDPPEEAAHFGITAYGMREAAATAKPGEPMNLRSSCGRFILGLLPQLDNPEKGMATLEAVSDGNITIEGTVTVRDRNGLVVLEGRLQGGRLARTCEKLSGIDLSTWTLVVNDTREP